MDLARLWSRLRLLRLWKCPRGASVHDTFVLRVFALRGCLFTFRSLQGASAVRGMLGEGRIALLSSVVTPFLYVPAMFGL